jgi:aminopeptidase N
MNRIFVLFLMLLSVYCIAKPPKKNKKNKKNRIVLEELTIKPQNEFSDYKASNTKYFDLLHTKIEIEPIVNQKIAVGKVELTLKPYFYNQNELVLDAKYMKIIDVKIKNNTISKYLSYSYDSLKLKINLDKTYTKEDTLTIYIEYIAQPYSIHDDVLAAYGRGMYFINADNKNAYKPFHIWTQGEEEANSFWFPTIDSPNEKSTQELLVTVDTSFITLSNGLLVHSKINGHKRTDCWKQDKPHTPYLFFLAIGNYKKYSTTWRNKAVEYYTFPEYFSDVQKVFANTPEMLEFFSNKLNLEFPWDKFSQIIVYDYTAGAMENTSAVIFYDRLLANKNQLVDENFDWIIAHELFHQWFGDLVTCESWANLTLNESLADYSEYLWLEYKYGKNDADAYGIESGTKYRDQLSTKNEPLVNYYYKAHHDNFDAIRYEKGGRILHMLRHYIGDDAFFKALNLYLNEHKYGTAEVSDFRKAVEEVCGEDYNWFFNQWYFGKGHPKLDINYTYNEPNKTLEIKVKQTQISSEAPIFKIPTYIDIFQKDTTIRKAITIIDKDAVFYFPVNEKPLFCNFDADGILLADISNNNTTDENIYKFNLSKNYKNKYDALNNLGNQIKENEKVQQVFINALENNDWNIRKIALNIIHENYTLFNQQKLIFAIKKMVQNEPKSIIRKGALQLISYLDNNLATNLSENILKKDSSNVCIAMALDILRQYKYPAAFQNAQKYLDTRSPLMLSTVGQILKDTTIDNLEFLKKAISLNNYRSATQNFDNLYFFLLKTTDLSLFKKGSLFLLDIKQHEESDYNILGAARTLKYLFNSLDYQQKDKKSSANLIAIHKQKIEILNIILPALKVGSEQFRF